MKKTKLTALLLSILMIVTSASMALTVSAELPYSDVNESMWSYDAIEYVTENGLMNGTGGTSFSPAVALTRSMVVTVLWRLEGAPGMDFTPGQFMDVEDGTFYTDAVIWAFENEIVTGTGTDEWGIPYFSPDREITRQELATMFVRYATFKYVITDNDATLDKFTDKDSVADWASEAMKWATSCGLINGTGNGSTLSPTGKATREQFATIIYRFETLDFDYHMVYNAPAYEQNYTAPVYAKVENADIYVAVDGNDKNDGSFNKPIATFERARDMVRELKKTAKDEIVVAFMAGEYGVLDNIAFNHEDAGTAEVPIKYCAYGNGDVIFCNGVKISNEEFLPITDAEAKKFPAEAKDYIYKVDLNGRIDEVTHKTLLFSETTVCHQARLPNKRSNGLDNYYEGYTTTHDERSSILLQGPLPKLVSEFSTVEGLKATGFLRTGWLVDTFVVKDFDSETGILTFDFDDPICFENGYTLDMFPLAFEGRMQDTIFFSNLPEFLDDKNEYWFDSETKVLYLYKPEGDYSVSSNGTFMTLVGGADHISFVGLEFNTTTSTAIYADGNYLTFDGCTVGNVGGTEGIYARGVNHFTAENCELYNFVCDGIKLDSNVDMALLEKDYNVIRNCYFHDFSLPQYWAHGILTYRCVGTVIEHNTFVNGAHAAIRFDQNIDTIIQYNVFDNMMMTTADYGAVYTFREVTYRGNEIRYNLFTNIRAGFGQYSIYLDGSYGVAVYGNLFYNGGNHNIVFNDGRDNDVHDNININNGLKGDFLMYNPGPYDLLTNPGKQEDVDALIGNYSRKPNPGEPGYELWYDRWEVMYKYNFDKESVGDFYSFYSTINYVKRNKFIGSEGNFGEIYDKFGVKEDNEEFALDENPYFADPTHGDYTIVKNADDFDSRYIFDASKVGRQ